MESVNLASEIAPHCSGPELPALIVHAGEKGAWRFPPTSAIKTSARLMGRRQARSCAGVKTEAPRALRTAAGAFGSVHRGIV
jgi:hypothetical protein